MIIESQIKSNTLNKKSQKIRQENLKKYGFFVFKSKYHETEKKLAFRAGFFSFTLNTLKCT